MLVMVVQYLQVFESWAGDLTPEAFNTFVLPCLKTIAQNVKKALSSSSDLKQSDTTSSEVPLCIFAKGAYYALEDLSAIGFDVVNVDWTVRPKEARQRVMLSLHHLGCYMCLSWYFSLLYR